MNESALRALAFAGLLAAATAQAGPRDTAPIFWAAIANDVVIARQYVADGGQLDALDRHGMTPLMYAADRGHADMVAFLLASGADPALRSPAGARAADHSTDEEVSRLLKAAPSR